MVSMRSRYHWLILPDRFKWAIITSQIGYYILNLTQCGARMDVYNELVSRAPLALRLVWPPDKLWTAFKSSACFLSKRERCFLDVPQRY